MTVGRDDGAFDNLPWAWAAGEKGEGGSGDGESDRIGSLPPPMGGWNLQIGPSHEAGTQWTC